MFGSWCRIRRTVLSWMGTSGRSCRRHSFSTAHELLESRQLLSATSADVSFAGRGQDLLLVVNPLDENALRIANAYQQLRHIPDRNILFLEPPMEYGFLDMSLEPDQFLSSIVTPIANAIQERGLANQIDFIGALGLPIRFYFDNPVNYGFSQFQSLSYGLTQLTQYSTGLDPALAQFVATAVSQADPGTAIHHSQTYSVTYNEGTVRTSQYYMGGLVAYTGSFGNSADQVIDNLYRTAAADGTHPVGTIYLEENDDVRSNTREYQWVNAETALEGRGIPVVREQDIPGATPQDRSDVRGAVVGSAEPLLPNGSTYLPGSWADNLTSYGGAFGPAQVKSTEFLAAGAAATSGTVEEPRAIANRFPSASIFTSIDDGLTLAEAYARSVVRPDLLQFFGDLLAQPYADLPRVEFTSGPIEGQTVSGNLSLTVSATLNQPRFATGISRLELYVDGALVQTINANQGTFVRNTNTLSDGVHEFRVVAVNNTDAESEGIAIRHVVVNNRGRSIVATPTHTDVSHDEELSVSVSTTFNSSSVQRIELQHLGRTIAESFGDSGTIVLDASRLAFGENSVVPVVVFADGEQVRGSSFVVNRSPEVWAALPASNPVDRTPGIRAEYFINQGAATIDASDFSGTPDIVQVHQSLLLTEQELATPAIDQLAIRFTGQFQVAGSTESEYLFTLIGTNDSARLTIDGRPVLSFDDLAYGVFNADGSATVFLEPGEHTFELLVSNLGSFDPGLRVDLRMRGPDGVTRIMDESNSYITSETPTPNRAPVANADGYSVTQGQVLEVPAAGVLGNDTDPDGDPLTALIDTMPQNGSITFNADGSFAYVPSTGYLGTDEFTYYVHDGQLTSVVTTVTIEIRSGTEPEAGVIEFDTSSQVVNEGDGTLTLTVNRRDGSSGPLDVSYTTLGGTATSNVDFTAANGQIHFADGETSKTIVIQITNDTLDEVEESFQVELTSVTGGGTLGQSTLVNVTIQDNDGVAVPARVSNVQPVRKRRKVTQLIISFDQAMNVTTVNQSGAYQLVDAGRDGRFGTRGDKRIAIRQVTYNIQSNSATLTLARAARSGRKLSLEIADQAIRGLNQFALDGDENGLPGGRYRQELTF